MSIEAGWRRRVTRHMNMKVSLEAACGERVKTWWR